MLYQYGTETASLTGSTRTDSPNGDVQVQREVPKTLDALVRAQHFGQELLKELYQKLSPVLMPDSPQATSDTKEPYPIRTEAAAAIYNTVRSQESFNSQLRDILERLEI